MSDISDFQNKSNTSEELEHQNSDQGTPADPTSGNHDPETLQTVTTQDGSSDRTDSVPQNNDPATLDSFRAASPEKQSTPDTVINSAFVSHDVVGAEKYDVVRDGPNTGERRIVDQGFMSQAHLDPARQRDPHGVYLDDQRQREAEVIRAQVEGREPDFSNMASVVGQPLIPVHVAEQHALPGSVVHAEVELPVVVGDYDRDHVGRAVDSNGKLLTEGGEVDYVKSDSEQ